MGRDQPRRAGGLGGQRPPKRLCPTAVDEAHLYQEEQSMYHHRLGLGLGLGGFFGKSDRKWIPKWSMLHIRVVLIHPLKNF